MDEQNNTNDQPAASEQPQPAVQPQPYQPEQILPQNDHKLSTDPAEPAVVTSPVPPLNNPQVTGDAAQSANKSSKRKLFGKLSLIPAAILVLFLIIGGSAAAYVGVVAPNKPENILKKSIQNTLKQTKVKFDGKISAESTDQTAAIKAGNVVITGQADTEKSAMQANIDLTVSGVKLPFEVRKVGSSWYVKVGDLSTIKNLVGSYAPGYVEILSVANDTLSNQWMEIDETLAKQATSGCSIDTNIALTEADIAAIQKAYQQNAYTTIKTSKSEKLNGRPSIKYELEINDNKAAQFADGLGEVSVIKKLKECTKGGDSKGANTMADGDITPLTIWVDKGTKTISKVAMTSTQKDIEKDKAKLTLEMSFVYGSVDISKPQGAKPAVEVLAELQSLLTGGSVQGAVDVKNLGNFDY